jgi:Mg/Co/Ni transporter MgtE
MVNATVSAKLRVPDFSGMFFGSIKNGVIELWHKIPYTEHINAMYLGLALAGILLLIAIVWFYANFIR